MHDLVVDYELDLGVTLSVVPIDYDNYLEWSRILPHYRNIEEERQRKHPLLYCRKPQKKVKYYGAD